MDLANSTTPEPAMGMMANVAGLNHDVWYLILRNLDTKQDLCNMCLVSKCLYPLVITHLYRTLIIGPRPLKLHATIFGLIDDSSWKKSRETQWNDSRALVRRLVEDPNREQAYAVREVELLKFHGGEEDVASDLEQKDSLPALVKALPNLQHFRLLPPAPDFEDLIRALNEHENRPQLHLLGEDGSRAVTRPISSVTALSAQVNPYYSKSRPPIQRFPRLQKMFFACPNLKSFSISVFRNSRGYAVWVPHNPRIDTFQLTGEETFPPLESLSLDGYRIEDEQWAHWRDKINWSDLTSLSLGPEPNTDLLKRFQGLAKCLRSFKVQTWAGEGKDICPELEAFIMSFDSLEQLEVRGHFLSVRALSHHTRLRQLCLHTMELPREGARRPTLDSAGLSELDAHCLDLETLEIDIYRDSGWPDDFRRTLASRFANLRHLTLHCEVGLTWDPLARAESGGRVDPLLPMLDQELARGFAQPFYALRPQSRLEGLTLKTGENLRRFPLGLTAYKDDEPRWSLSVHIRAPSNPDELLVVDVEREP
ncbi:hypothetical protein BR93DRAFT_965517 [Coniochaeta sp. PMI_546]|nr:hypothetical protein BR93DRAFT_965517 [Coniochaeta sp. PMI_546]